MCGTWLISSMKWNRLSHIAQIEWKIDVLRDRYQEQGQCCYNKVFYFPLSGNQNLDYTAKRDSSEKLSSIFKSMAVLLEDKVYLDSFH